MTDPTKIFTQIGGIFLKFEGQVDSDSALFLYYAFFFPPSGQVAQLVERGPEKAGVGGSIPSLATIN